MKSREISRSKIGPFSLACTDPYIGIGWENQSKWNRSASTFQGKRQNHSVHVFIKSDLFTPRMGAAYIFVAVFFEYLRMRNFSVFSICSHCFYTARVQHVLHTTGYSWIKVVLDNISLSRLISFLLIMTGHCSKDIVTSIVYTYNHGKYFCINIFFV